MIGNFGIKGKSHNEKSRQRWEFMEEMAAAKEMIQQEVKGFWKNAIVIVSLLFAGWFFMVHSLPGEGRLETGGGRTVKVMSDNISFPSIFSLMETFRTFFLGLESPRSAVVNFLRGQASFGTLGH